MKIRIELKRVVLNKTSPLMRELLPPQFLRGKFCKLSTRTRSGKDQLTLCFLYNLELPQPSETILISRDKILYLWRTPTWSKLDRSSAKKISPVVFIGTHHPLLIYQIIVMGHIHSLKRVLKQVIRIAVTPILIHRTTARIRWEASNLALPMANPSLLNPRALPTRVNPTSSTTSKRS